MRYVYPWLVAVPFMLGVNAADEPKPTPKLPTKAEVMAAKMKQSQLVLEGIALHDWKKIGDSADELVRISQAAEFLNAHKGEEYRLQMILFRRTVENVSKKAKDKNMDGVLVNYMEMTLSCVKCHQHTRDTKLQ